MDCSPLPWVPERSLVEAGKRPPGQRHLDRRAKSSNCVQVIANCNHLDRRLAKGNRGDVVGAVGAVGQHQDFRFQIRLPAPLLPGKSVNKDMEITPGKIG